MMARGESDRGAGRVGCWLLLPWTAVLWLCCGERGWPPTLVFKHETNAPPSYLGFEMLGRPETKRVLNWAALCLFSDVYLSRTMPFEVLRLTLTARSQTAHVICLWCAPMRAVCRAHID